MIDRMQQHVHLTHGRGSTHIWRDHAIADGRSSPKDGGTPCRDSASVTSLGHAPTLPGWPIAFSLQLCLEARVPLRAPHGSDRPDAGRLLAAYTAQCIWIAARLRTWLDDRSNVCPARVGVWPRNGLSSHRSSRGHSNTHTAVIQLAAANYAGSQPADGRMPDAE